MSINSGLLAEEPNNLTDVTVTGTSVVHQIFQSPPPNGFLSYIKAIGLGQSSEPSATESSRDVQYLTRH